MSFKKGDKVYWFLAGSKNHYDTHYDTIKCGIVTTVGAIKSILDNDPVRRTFSNTELFTTAKECVESVTKYRIKHLEREMADLLSEFEKEQEQRASKRR